MDISELPIADRAEYYRRVAVRAGHYARLCTDQKSKESYASLAEQCRRLSEAVDAETAQASTRPTGVRRNFIRRGARRTVEYRARVVEALTLARLARTAAERAELFAIAEAWSARARRLDAYLARIRNGGREVI